MNTLLRERCINISHLLFDGERKGKNFHTTFLIKKGKIICMGINDYTQIHPYHIFGKYKCCRTGDYYDSGRHSEINAIRTYQNKIGNSDFSKVILFNVRVNKKRNILNSKPCQNCQKILDLFNFKSILHT